MSTWKNVIGQTAPLLGSLLGGSLGANAGRLLGNILLGNEQASTIDIENALMHPTPAQLIALKQIEADLQAKLHQVAFEEKKLITQDRDSARSREVQVRDKIPALLAILLTVGFFGILVAMMFLRIEAESRSIIDVMLGALGTAWISCITYYFGSSYGSQTKNALLARK